MPYTGDALEGVDTSWRRGSDGPAHTEAPESLTACASAQTMNGASMGTDASGWWGTIRGVKCHQDREDAGTAPRYAQALVEAATSPHRFSGCRTGSCPSDASA